MLSRRFVPTGFFAILLLGAAAFVCSDVTLACSRVHPVSVPLMAVCILLSLGLLLYFGASLICYLYDHYFSHAFTRWLLIGLFALLLAAFLALMGRNLVHELAGAPRATGNILQVLPRYWDHLTGQSDKDSYYVSRQTANSAPAYPPDNIGDGLGRLVALVVYALACSLFYRKYRNHLILHRGYDTDNLLDILLSVVLAVAVIAGLIWPIAFAAAGGALLLLLLRRLRRLGPLHGLAISLVQPFALLDMCFHQGSRAMAYMAAPRNNMPSRGAEYTGANVVSSQDMQDDASDAAIRRQLMERYKARKAEEEARRQKDEQ